MQISIDTIDPSDIITVQETTQKSNGEDLVRTYIRGRMLGKGGFASVYEFICQDTQEIYACKIISKDYLQKPRARQKLFFEIKIHRSMHHPHIVQFFRFFEDQRNIYVLLELCQNQTLCELVKRRKRLTELEVQCYVAQVVSALKYLHGHRVIHRDIKLSNLFLNEKMEIKLGDFGLATKLEFEGERKSTVCGTPNYIAPEIIDGQFGHSFEVDIWGLGVLIYSLLIGKPPFETPEIKQTYRKIRNCAYNFPASPKLSSEAKELIMSLLVLDPTRRLSLDSILYHPFMTKNPIPRTLSTSTLAVPPKTSYLKQFQSKHDSRKSLDVLTISSASKESLLGSTGSTSNRYSSGLNGYLSASNDYSSAKNLPNKSLPNSSNNLSPHMIQDSGSINSKKIAMVSYYTPLPNTAKIFTKKWVDYSNKYGLGYVLSNNFIGVYFNDHSKFVCNLKGEFQVVSKVKNEEVTQVFKLNDFPEELRKKVAILEHFRKYLSCEPVQGVSFNEFVYVKKWMQTEKATIFCLSNKTVHARFLDSSEIILSSGVKTVAFLNNNGNCEAYPLKSAMQSDNKELVKRIKFTTEMISKMLAQKK